jgi:hypothetical protein
MLIEIREMLSATRLSLVVVR